MVDQITRVIQSENLDHSLNSIVGVCENSERRCNSSFEWQLKSSSGVVTAYTSGKIVIQGKDETWVQDIYERLGGENQDSRDTKDSIGSKGSGRFTPHIGVDEAGKGDYFGAMVISAVFVDSPETGDELVKIGVRDSKKISDKRAIELREKILKICKHTSEVIISPEKYNELYKKFNNVNKMLAWAHAQSIESLLEDADVKKSCEEVIIDQFSKRESRVIDALMENGKQVKITQRHGGESDIAVAAASIVARGRFLLELRALGKKYNTNFPKGASQVIDFGKKFLREHGIEELKKVAKFTFKTSLKITSTFDI